MAKIKKTAANEDRVVLSRKTGVGDKVTTKDGVIFEIARTDGDEIWGGPINVSGRSRRIPLSSLREADKLRYQRPH